MDIQEASLIKRMLDALTGTTGMQVRRLANQCQASPRRVNHLVLHLQNIGLIDIDERGMASLSTRLAETAVDHVQQVKAKGHAFDSDSVWAGVSQAIDRQLKAIKEDQARRNETPEVFKKLFDEIFGEKWK